MTRIYSSMFKGQKAVTLENDLLRVVVLPKLGGKVSSFFHKEKGFELAAQRNAVGCDETTPRDCLPGVDSYDLPLFGASFGQFDASGIDDAFPNVIPSEEVVGAEPRSYPDHGEIWSAQFASEILGDQLRLFYESKYFSYRYVKRITLSDSRLLFRYEIENFGAGVFPCLWTFHGLMRYEEDMRVLLPKWDGVESSGRREILNVFDSKTLGEDGRIYDYEGEEYDFRGVPPASSNDAIKFFLNGSVQEGSCGLEYPSVGLRCKLDYDKSDLPYLGFWLTAGRYRGDYNCALEPASGFYDSLPMAEASGTLWHMKPDEVRRFYLGISLEGMGCNSQKC